MRADRGDEAVTLADALPIAEEWIAVTLRPYPHHPSDPPLPKGKRGLSPKTLRVFHVPARATTWKACKARLLWQVHPDDVRAIMGARGEKFRPGDVFYVCGHRIVAPKRRRIGLLWVEPEGRA